MKPKIFILGCIIIAGLVSCEKEEIDLFTIEYTRSSGWVDYYYSVTLDQNGTMRVLYHHGLINYHRESYYQINNTDIVNLKDNLTVVSSINLKDRYGFGANKPTDLPVTSYFYKTNIKSDSTSIYSPKDNELPDELVSFIVILDEIITVTDKLLVR